MKITASEKQLILKHRTIASTDSERKLLLKQLVPVLNKYKKQKGKFAILLQNRRKTVVINNPDGNQILALNRDKFNTIEDVIWLGKNLSKKFPIEYPKTVKESKK